MSIGDVGRARAHEPVGEQRGPVTTFSRVLRGLAAVMMLVGLSHVIFGVAMDVQLGAAIAPPVASDPVLDSQNRFFGAVFIGYGALLYLSVTELRRYAPVFRLVAGSVALGGVARLLSIALRGLPPPPVLGLVAVEVLLVPLLLVWHALVVARLERIRPGRSA